MTVPYRVIVADDHPLVRGALRQAVQQALPEARVSEAGSLEDLAAEVGAGDDPVDLVLLDLNMPGSRGFAGLLTIRAQHPAVPVVVVSGSEDRATVRRAIDCGAAGFVPKSAEVGELSEAIRAVLSGGIWTPPDLDLEGVVQEEAAEADIAARVASLTPQQLKVLIMLAEGKPNKVIAYEMDVTEAGVKAHMTNIFRKLGVASRTQAVIAAGPVLAGPAAEGEA